MTKIGYNEELQPNGTIAKSWTRRSGTWLIIFAMLLTAFQIVTGYMTLQDLIHLVEQKIITPEQMKLIGTGIGGIDIALISLFLATGMGGKLVQKNMESNNLDSSTPVPTPAP
jgi:hypothetical protein